MPGNDDQKGGRNPWGRPTPEKPQDKGSWSQKHGPENNPGPDLEAFLRNARLHLGNPLGSGGRGLVLLFVIALILWVASGVYRVDSSENAVIQRFGAYTRTQIQAGLGYHLPWPIETMTKLNTTLDRRVQIGFADNDYTGTQRHDVAEESLMLTADANIVDIDVVVLWNVAEAEKFIFNIRNPELTIKRVAESAIRDIVSQTPLQSIITQKRNDVAVGIQKLLQSVLDAYGSGVAIKQVLIQAATVHPDVLEAYNDVAASRQDAQRFQNEATIYRNDIIPKARGAATKMRQDAQAYKQQVIAKSEGDAQRFSQIMDAYRSGKDVTRDRLYIETMEQVLNNANSIIIDQKEGASGPMTVLSLDVLRAKTSANPSLDAGQ